LLQEREQRLDIDGVARHGRGAASPRAPHAHPTRTMAERDSKLRCQPTCQPLLGRKLLRQMKR
jgi:hypothetical protein